MVALAVSVLAGGTAFAQGQAMVAIQTTATYNAVVRISAVDTNARTATVTYADGGVRTYKVGPAVANFGTTKIGDTVTVGFEEKRSFVLSGPNTKTPSSSDASSAVAVSAGQSAVGV